MKHTIHVKAPQDREFFGFTLYTEHPNQRVSYITWLGACQAEQYQNLAAVPFPMVVYAKPIPRRALSSLGRLTIAGRFTCDSSPLPMAKRLRAHGSAKT